MKNPYTLKWRDIKMSKKQIRDNNTRFWRWEIKHRGLKPKTTKNMKTWQDVYKDPPFVKDEIGDWVYDSERNFLFQFEISWSNQDMIDRLLSVINGETIFTNDELRFRHEGGYILDNLDQKILLIRGWGNLTGIGGLNLPEEQARNIQDTLAEFIVERLNKRKDD